MADHALTQAPEPVALEPRRPAIVALPSETPSLSELFTFMRDAELRFSSLRMRIADAKVTSRGPMTEQVEAVIRHPGYARVTRRFGTDVLTNEYTVWLSDGDTVRTYDARSGTASARSARRPPVGVTREDLPGFSRVYVPVTGLPPESLVNTFVHPHGLCRNLLVTGPLSIVGGDRVAGREAIVIRCDHPRRSEVWTDRPDRSIEVAVDRMTGLVLRLGEQTAGEVTRRAEVTHLEIDPVVGDDLFQLHLSEDVTVIY
jgi:hypothetical protein